MKQKLKPISELTTAEELLAIVGEIRDQVRALPEEEQKKYYEGDKAKDKQLGEEIEEGDEQTPPNGEEEQLNKDPNPTSAEDEPKEIPQDEPQEEDEKTPNPPTAENNPAPTVEPQQTKPQEKDKQEPQKVDAMAVLLEVRDMLRKNLHLEMQEQQEETPKSKEELEKPTLTDEEETYENEDFFK